MQSSIEDRVIRYLRSVLPRTSARQFATLQRDFERLRDVGEIAMRLVVEPDRFRGDGEPCERFDCGESWFWLGGGRTTMTTFPWEANAREIVGTPFFSASVYVGVAATRTEKEINELLESCDRTVIEKSRDWDEAAKTGWMAEVPVEPISSFRPPADDAFEFADIAGEACKDLRLSSLDIGPTEGIHGRRRWLAVLHLLESFGLIQGIGEARTIDDDQVHKMILASCEVAHGRMDEEGHKAAMQAIRRAGFTYTVKRFVRSSALAAGILHDIVTGELAADPRTAIAPPIEGKPDDCFSDYRGSGPSYADPNPTEDHRVTEPVAAFIWESQKYLRLQDEEAGKLCATDWDLLTDDEVVQRWQQVDDLQGQRWRVRNSLQSLVDEVAELVAASGGNPEAVIAVVMATEHDESQFTQRWQEAAPVLRAARHRRRGGDAATLEELQAKLAAAGDATIQATERLLTPPTMNIGNVDDALAEDRSSKRVATEALESMDRDELCRWSEIADLHLRWLQNGRKPSLSKPESLRGWLEGVGFSEGPQRFKELLQEDRTNKSRHGFGGKPGKKAVPEAKANQEKWANHLKSILSQCGL